MKIRIKVAVVLTSVGCGGARPPGIVSAPATQQPLPQPSAASVPPSAAAAASPAAVSPQPRSSNAARPEELVAAAIPLPGATAPVSLDFLFYEPDASRVWVPAGGSGSVDVFDIAKHGFTRIEGFQTAEREAHGRKRVLGPSAGAVAGSFAYIGNRASQEVCAVDLKSLKKGPCLKLSTGIDCVEFVPATQEVWVTAPSVQSLIVLQALPKGALKQKATIKLDGAPEGYALDQANGLFLTNLEDKGSTLAIDVNTHAVRSTWQAACAADGPRGVALDSERGIVFVACTDHVQAVDVAHGGALLGKLDTGAGLDNIDYVAKTGLLYAAAGKAAKLTVARLDKSGQFEVAAVGVTAEGARNAVADASGTVYVADPQGAHLLVLRPKRDEPQQGTP
jgi:DNA-binding beta-propeller fold protein YncE